LLESLPLPVMVGVGKPMGKLLRSAMRSSLSIFHVLDIEAGTHCGAS